MKVYFLLVGFGDDLVIVDGKSVVQDVNQGGRKNRFNASFQHSKVIDVFFECCPVCCQVTCLDAEDIVNESFLVEYVYSMF